MGGIAKLGAKVGKSLFDMSDARNVPDVPQFALERYDPPRGMPKGLASIMTPENARRLEEIAKRGMDMGGPEWYYTIPLKERFVAELGPEEGPLAFRRFIDYVSATSPRAKVPENIRRGSYFYGRERQGLPVTVPKTDLPPGYGHLAHTSAHMASLRDLEGGGTFAALNRPKTTSFSENLSGNWEPLTVDTHNMKVVANVDRSPTAGEYGYLEQYQSEIADKLGLTPAQFQASLWVAGDTGVANIKPFLVVFDEVVERTAVKDKKDKEQVLKDFITGEAPLFGLATLMSGLMVQDDKPVAEGKALGGAVSSAAAKAIRRLVEAGFPESTAEKIVMGELPMDRASVNRRRFAQGKTMPVIHTGDARAAKAPFFDPDINAAAGTFSTDNPYLANTYYNPGGSADRMAMYPLFLDDSDYALVNANIGSDWMEMSGDIMTPDASDIIESFSDLNTNEVARRVRELGYPGVRMEGVQDVGPAGADAAYDAAYQIGLKESGGDPDYAEEFARGIVTDVERNLGEGQGMIFSSFDPKTVRSRYAAFDPDQVGSPNLLAGLGPAAIGAGLLGASMAPEEAEAAPFGTLARMLGKRTQETFHGSPYLFDQVDMSRMGSGEGTQFEGAGFYSAGARPTAESYQRDLAGYYGGSDAVEQRAYSDAFDLAEEYAGDRDPEDVLDEIMSSIADQDYERLPLELQGPAREIEARSRGALYRTEIPAEDLLDWDAPLADQPENIRSAVMDTARAAKADAADPGAIDLEALPGMTGGDAYEQLRAVYGNEASAELNNRGVLGVQYFDAASREAGEGTRNYVVFDEANVNVVERNGEPIAALPRGRTAAGVAGLLGAGALASPEEAEAAPFGTLAKAIGRGTLRAYTGSPAKYATPSIQRVGTGEGNQAFGYGLYFSDSPQIAGGYRRGVSGGKVLDRMSDRYLLDDLDLQSVDEMIDLGEFDPEDEKLMRALRDADYLGFDRPMEAVRTAFSPDINAFDPSDPAVQKLQKIADEVGFLYEAEVPAENFIDWNLPLDEQPEVVRQVVTESAKDPKLRERIEDGTFRGSDAYYVFGNNPEVNSAMWAQYGVPGVRYNSFGRTIRGLDDARARKSAPQNYVIFDENLINVVRRNDEALENNFDELAARASALDVRKPMAAVLGAGAAGATQAGQDDTFGDYDQRQTAIASQALDRLLMEAKMKEGAIGPQEVLEAAATIGSGILGSVPAGLAGLYTLATTGDREAAEAKINEITESLTYMPTSQGSINALQAAVGPLEALAAPSEYVGQKTMDITGSPLLATASEIFLDPLNLLSFGGLGAALKRAGRSR